MRSSPASEFWLLSSNGMKSGNIYLVGFMGAGKTSVGERLAVQLQWAFLDLDQEIEKTQGRSIREIFENEGEPSFRELERDELQKVSLRQKTVVALGGGAFLDARNRETISGTGISVWLDAPIDTLYRRCAGERSRPLFTSRQEMERLLACRLPYYRMASIHIAVDDLSVDDLTFQIMRLLEAD